MSAFTLRRRAARVLLLDRSGSERFLLLQGSDPADPAKGRWWELPGGGIHGDESSAETARRELYEEAGIAEAEMGPCVWTRHTRFRFAGLTFDQHERIHVAWCEGARDVTPTHLEALEAAALDGGRWWRLDELLSCDDQCWPSRIRDFLPPLLRGELPDDPVDVGH